MPVVTRSCGKQQPRRRIEDPTPVRTCRTTAKRRKELSDEESERPPKKKPSIGSKPQERPKTICDKRNEGPKRSRIPQRCVSEKHPVKTKSVCNDIADDDDDDDDEVQFKITEVKTTKTPEATNEQNTEPETPVRSPVASRTRSYSTLKRSYKRKKQNQESNKPSMMETSQISTSGDSDIVKDNGQDSSVEKEKENEEPFQVKEVDSSTHEDENVMNEKGEDQLASSNAEGNNDQYYKKKFHEMVKHLKEMQEQFSQTHENTRKNITAYDVFVKELKACLEQEKKKNATIEEELSQTREQLLIAQKEIETVKTNERQHNKSMNTTFTMQGSSQNEENSQLEELEKAETSNLLAMIKFYAGITGISLANDSPSSNSELIESYRCVYRPKGPNGNVMQFRLTHDKEFGEFEYSPNFQSPKRGEYLHKIPGYLKENMYFNTDQVQTFLASLITAVQKV